MTSPVPPIFWVALQLLIISRLDRRPLSIPNMHFGPWVLNMTPPPPRAPHFKIWPPMTYPWWRETHMPLVTVSRHFYNEVESKVTRPQNGRILKKTWNLSWRHVKKGRIFGSQGWRQHKKTATITQKSKSRSFLAIQ